MSAPLSPEQLAEIRARMDAAAPGPWETDTYAEYDSSTSIGVANASDLWIVPLQQLDPADAAFIAAARTDVPALLAEVDRLRSAARSAADIFRSVAGRAQARQWPNPSMLRQAAADLDRISGGEPR
ncbi:hypothetical protein V2S66_25255 [Streptomyces sp. V4-01]|uniref:Uncharacterized protein n=1 Tax=Actinacidiphila polyblastidii TaxID=3110430 RepID=A0ABU7PHG3_9ACTN|nr:hypothetical protein [Streptomyces sp. V4-01]